VSRPERAASPFICDRTVAIFKTVLTTYLNVEMAATDEMVDIALRTKPDAVSLVPENANEVTTEGGLDIVGNFDPVKKAIDSLREAGIFSSVFIDPNREQIDAANSCGAQQIEICTAEYADMTLAGRAVHGATAEKAVAGMHVAAGHGLTYRNVGALAAIPAITEFNIGHNIISRAVFVGLSSAVKEMIEAIRQK
jgi:pyridoxine 5-phosphate synthase